MQLDSLHVIEAMYDVDSDDATWLTRLADVVQQALGAGRGVIANAYDVSSPDAVRIDATSSGLAPGFFEFFMKTSEQLDEGYVRQSYLSSTPCAMTSEFGGWSQLPFVRSGALAQWNVADDLILRGWEPGGRGVTLNVFQPARGRLTPVRRAHLARIARHLGAAYRLRRQLASHKDARATTNEAVLDTRGTVHHAVGTARECTARARLVAAVAEMERARGELRREAPTLGVRHWKALVAGRWSLVDEFQSGSGRYIVAYANELDARGPAVLSARERQVATYAAAGHWSKLIAYELGIADSTVRVLLSRAMAKLGVHSREELAKVVAGWPSAQ